MAQLIIREEIQKHELQGIDIHAKEAGTVIPTQQQLADHVFTKDKQGRNKFEDHSLLLMFKTSDGKKFTVCIWELLCSSIDEYTFYGYCDVRYYGSGLYTEKSGYGFRLISGNVRYDEEGSPIYVRLTAMPEKTYHR